MQHLQQAITCLRAARVSRKKRNAILTELFWVGKKGRDLSEKKGVKQALTALEDDGDIRTTKGGKAKLTPQGVERFAAISKKKADLVKKGVRQHASVVTASVPWVYHVTTIGRLPGIQAKGLRPGRTATWGSHAAHSKGKIFFTTARGVPRWMHKIWYAIGGDSAAEVPVVLRLRADKLTDAERDHLGTQDVRENAYAVRTGVPAALLSVWDGQRWLRLKEADPEALVETAKERSEVEVVEDEESGEPQEIVWWNEEALEPPLPVRSVEMYSRERKLPGSASAPDEKPEAYRKRVGRCPRGFHWDGQTCVDVRKKVADSVASKAHAAWARDFRRDNPNATTRMKDDGAGGQVDILNTEYKDLPEKWKKENRLGGQAAVEALEKFGDDMEAAAAYVHDKWLERNGSWAPEHQKKPYEELSEEEKEKDRIFVRLAQEAERNETGSAASAKARVTASPGRR